MKLDPILHEMIKNRIQPRQILFITTAKLYCNLTRSQWIQNCNGFFILQKHQKSYFLTIIQIKTLFIMFDMEIYTNFNNYCKFNGQNKCMFFIVPTTSDYLKALLVLESKAQLLELKHQLDDLYNVSNSQEGGELSFLKRPDIHQILVKAEVDEKLLDTDLLFKQQVEEQIKQFLKSIEAVQKFKSKSGFKVYGIGRQEWALKEDQKLYLKQKNEIQTIENLRHLYKQAKIRNVGNILS